MYHHYITLNWWKWGYSTPVFIFLLTARISWAKVKHGASSKKSPACSKKNHQLDFSVHRRQIERLCWTLIMMDFTEQVWHGRMPQESERRREKGSRPAASQLTQTVHYDTNFVIFFSSLLYHSRAALPLCCPNMEHDSMPCGQSGGWMCPFWRCHGPGPGLQLLVRGATGWLVARGQRLWTERGWGD